MKASFSLSRALLSNPYLLSASAQPFAQCPIINVGRYVFNFSQRTWEYHCETLALHSHEGARAHRIETHTAVLLYSPGVDLMIDFVSFSIDSTS